MENVILHLHRMIHSNLLFFFFNVNFNYRIVLFILNSDDRQKKILLLLRWKRLTNYSKLIRINYENEFQNLI